MFVNNYWNYLSYTTTTYINPSGSSYTGLDIGLFDISGNSVPFLVTPYGAYVQQNYMQFNGISAIVGSGTSEPSSTDYGLSTDETSKFSNFTVTYSTANVDGKLKTAVIIMGKNNTNSAITISEIGIVKRCYAFKAPNSYQLVDVMMTHELLDTPIIVEPHSGLSILYMWVHE